MVMTRHWTAPPPDTNELGQPVGYAVHDWAPVPLPPREPMEGRLCRVEPIDVGRHAADLFEANSLDAEGRMFSYLAYGPFKALSEYVAWMERTCLGPDPFFHAIVDRASGKALGVASLLRIDAANGVIEVGHIAYSPLLQRTAMATEAMYLLMDRVFELGYRRYEWKCNALNAPSRNAAMRLGFSYEGVFRQAVVIKGRNRDTAWYAMVDGEWPELREAYRQWLDPANFDGDGRQRVSLSSLTEPVLKARG
jgi:RimJ/RimL family protein N-acetyltransferase